MSNPVDPSSRTVDVAVIGGGAAGLAAALALGRSHRSVVVIDAGEPRNASSPHMHGYLGLDGLPPQEFLALGRRDVERYDVELVSGRVVGATRTADDGFAVQLSDGSAVNARRLLVATGLTDELPDVAGLRERWGIDVLHCPYCHGWEVRDQAIVVLSTGPMAAHSALMFRQLSANVTLATHTGPRPTDEDLVKLAARGVRVVDGRVDEVVVRDGHICGVRLAAGTVIDCEAIVVTPRLVAHSPILESFGLQPVAHPMGAEIGMTYPAQPTGQTTVAGVWATGNVVDAMATVPAASAAGYLTGAVINADLIAEETAAAVEHHRLVHTSEQGNRDDHSNHADHADHGNHGEPGRMPVLDQAFWDGRYSSAERIWSGNPNPHLVSDIGELPAGRALDVGAGEGADAIWLAENGWTVTAVDISPVALERGRQEAEAEARRAEVAERITWTQLDVLTDPLPEGPFDLVSLQFMHFNTEDREPLFARCAAGVAPGGTLQIVAHHPSDLDTTIGRWRMPDAMYTADEIAASLDDDWTVLAADARPRQTTDGEGRTVTIHDTVLVARRNT